MIIDTAEDSKKERKNTQYLKKRLGKRDLSHKLSTHGTYNPSSLRSSQFIDDYGEKHSFLNKPKPNSLSTNTLLKIDRTNLDSPASKINPQFKIHNLKSGLRMRTKSVPALKVNRRFSVDASRSNLSEENVEREKRTVEAIDMNNERRYWIDARISNEKKYFEERTHSFKNKREQQDITSSNDDWRSLNTDVLVDSPRMPLFNASPSLTTESLVSETNSTKSYHTLIENLALKTSFLASDNESQGSGYLKLAVTSHREDKNDSVEPLFSGYNETRSCSRADNIDAFPRFYTSEESRPIKPFTNNHLINDITNEEDRSSISEDGFAERSVESLKTATLTNNQLIKEDRSSISEDGFAERSVESLKTATLTNNQLIKEDRSSISEDSFAKRPVESFKKMLFTAQRLTYSEDEGNNCDGLDQHSLTTKNKENCSNNTPSEVSSTVSQNEGNDSLSRAYFHLARLKRLVSATKEVASW
ncbi:uncharacterized protein LOC124451168 [Xenia sp. Carnegie-2017]|uniref:uncharacterized protein LOC124451168 n=1 Tax=Xenia sp. Carnegie-2017 TaxID=2897299 RepID=UPI001F03F897|nr:uncharacterized protein LOC124451168 [Xenia sp. Carnegie-2017]